MVAQNYMKSWYLDNSKYIDFTTPISTLNSLTGIIPFTSSFVTNGIYGNSNNLLFYVKDYTIYNRNGQIIASAPISLPHASCPSCPLNRIAAGPEVIITQVPVTCDVSRTTASCSKYYVIYNLVQSYGLVFYSTIMYTEVDMNLNNGLGGATVGRTNVIIDQDYSVNAYIGLAIGKMHGTNNRFLYSSANNYGTNNMDLKKFIVDDSGILLTNTWTFPIGGSAPFYTLEMDLSPDQSMLACANSRSASSGAVGNDVIIFYLNPVTGDLNPSINGGFKPVVIDQTKVYAGVEFAPDNSKLFVGVKGVGIKNIINLTTTSPTVNPLPISGTSSYGNSQLETAYNSSGNYFIYAAASPTNLGILDPNTNVFTTSGITSSQSFLIGSSSNVYISNSGNTDFIVLPDQIDDEDYERRFDCAPVECCLNSSAFNAIDYFVTGSNTQIWTPANNPFGGTPGNPLNTVNIRGTLTIPAGYNVTIQGMIFKFSKRVYSTAPAMAGANVVVERASLSTSGVGGKLILDNTTFTSFEDCGQGMWEGIEVRGYTNIPQSLTSSKQGWLVVKNNSIIENAYHAVVVSKVVNPFNGVAPYNSTPQIDNNYNGGIVQVTSLSRFRNNYIDVYFSSYDVPSASIDNNNSSFNNCYFETTASLKDPNLDKVNWLHNILIGVKGIPYNGVWIVNNDPTNPDYDILQNKRGIGILSINSNFTVGTFMLPFKKSAFSNLTYGVYAVNFGNTKTFSINQTLFTDNYRGIYVGAVNYESITQNNFTINKWPSTTNPAYGLYLDGCKGFKVQENDFTYAGTTSPAAYSYGVIVNQSNPNRNCNQADEIYKNKFHSIYIGARAQGNNSEFGYATCYPSSPSNKNNIGLVFKCNDFYSNVDANDLSVMPAQSGIPTTGNIAYFQGTSINNQSPAGNTFSHTSGAVDFFATPTFVSNDILYTHHTGAATTPITFTTPQVYLSSCASCGMYLTNNSCPTKIGPKSPILIKGEIFDSEQQKTMAKNKIDGGNTNYLLQQIYGSMSAGNLKNLLMSKSPYLSDRVLIAYIEKIGVPNGHIKDVVIANSPVTQSVKDALDRINLPNGIRSQINAAQTGVSGRAILEGEISYYTSSKSLSIDELIRTYLNDTTLEYGVDSVLLVFKQYNIPESKNEQAKALLTKCDITNTLLMVDSIRTEGNYESFTKMMDVAIALHQSEEGIQKLATDNYLKQQVEELASNSDKNEYSCSNSILKFVFNSIFNEYIAPADNNRMMNSVTQNNTFFDNLGSIIYPNPNNGIMYFNYTLGEDEIGLLNIYDVTGKIVITKQLNNQENIITINDEELNSGVYFYKYFVNDKHISSDKIIIIK